MRLLTIILFISCLASVLSQTVNGQGFSISPSRVFFRGNPGETVTHALTFANTSSNKLSFVTKIQDWERDSIGNKVYYDSSTRPSSNAKWLSIPGNEITIEPGETKHVILTMVIPTDARQLSHSMIFFTQRQEQQPVQAAKAVIGINIIMEVGIQVYYIPKGLNAGDLEFLAFEDRGLIETAGVKKRTLAIKIRNNGGLNKDAWVRIELTNKETGEEIKVEPVTIAMLPDATQWITVNLPGTLKGKFLAIAMLDAGSFYDLKVAEKELIYHP
jgi:hypothetical protein